MTYRNCCRAKGARRSLRVLRSLLFGLAVWLSVHFLPGMETRAQAASPNSAAPQAAADISKLSLDEKLRTLKLLLNDPAITSWASAQTKTAAKPEASTASVSVATLWLDRIRVHLRGLAGAAAAFPRQLAGIPGVLAAETRPFGFWRTAFLIALALGLGFLGEWTSARLVGGARDRDAVSLKAFAANLLPIVGFGVGSALAFVLLDWPAVWQRIVFGYLLAYLGTRLAIALGKLVLAARMEASPVSGAGTGPVLSTGDDLGSFWYRRVLLFIGYFLFGWVTVDVLTSLGFAGGLRSIAAYLLGLGLLVIAMMAVWQEPGMRDPVQRRPVKAILLSLFFVVLWLLWVGGLNGLLWLGIYTVILRPGLRVAGTLGRFLGERPESAVLRVRLLPVLAERFARALLIAIAVLWLARVIGFQTESIAQNDNLLGRVTRGALGGIVVLLIADFLWQLAKTFIDGVLEDAKETAGVTEVEKARRAKLKTLLPIFRHILAAMVWVLAGLMVLAGLGVQIGPLIAGAGVIGVAVGFGAQTVVRDVISGMFYLWDDAFRVGEYIQSGKYMGVVEGFSLRSVRLRHHRGPIYTVPFGELGAVENMSRDWVIDKMTIGVTYDTDIAKVKKIIKEIGAKLQADPEFAPNILETLKMKGVDQFGDFAIQLRLAMMTIPGEQFVIRRRAYAMIKEAFDENGIHFAYPTVQVAGDEKADRSTLAAARNVMAIQAEKQATP